jgi:hypothetical protein
VDRDRQPLVLDLHAVEVDVGGDGSAEVGDRRLDDRSPAQERLRRADLAVDDLLHAVQARQVQTGRKPRGEERDRPPGDDPDP